MRRFEIQTDRLLIKPLGPEYLDSTNEYAMNLENTKYMMYLPNDTSDETKMFLKNVEIEWSKENPSFYEFALIFKKKHIGGVSVYIEDGVGEIEEEIKKPVDELDKPEPDASPDEKK